MRKSQSSTNKHEFNELSESITDGIIPLSRAISNADFIYKEIEGSRFKHRKISSVDILSTSNIGNKTRSTNHLDEGHPLAYIVNYENNEGYAILAADIQFPPIIGIGDEGNFSTKDFVEFTNNANTRALSNLSPAQEVQFALINNSMLMPAIGEPNAIVAASDTAIILKCLPLVSTKWGQHDPYNYYAPLDSLGLKSLAGCVPVAGAQTLASLCYHHNWRPSVQICEDFNMDWYAINRMINADSLKFSEGNHSPNALKVASLIRAIGYDIEAAYSSNGTGANTHSLTSTYTKLGMNFTRFGNETSPIDSLVTKDDIFEMILINNYPVNARARNSITGRGHSFILDGWLRLEYSVLGITGGHTIGQITSKVDNIQYNFDLVHVNFGAGGSYDGYFHYDAFNLSEDEYHKYAEENDIPQTSSNLVYDLDVYYLIYDI